MKPHMRDGKTCDCGKSAEDCAEIDEFDSNGLGRVDGFEDQPRDEAGRWGEGDGDVSKASVSKLNSTYILHAQNGELGKKPKDRHPEMQKVMKELKARGLTTYAKVAVAMVKEKHDPEISAMKKELESLRTKKDSTRVLRLDRGELEKPVRMSNGWLKVDGRLTRTGVFLYRNADGSERRELRLPEEVFKADSLGTFSMAPVTDEHPPVFLDASNTKEWARGSVSEHVTRDGDAVRARMLVTDADLIAKMEKGDAVEVSCGYNCDLEESAGVHQGERYDCIQRNITGNHVAIVAKGRAGRDARVRMDSAAERVVEIVPPGRAPMTQEKNTVKIKIDGIEYDAGSDAAVQAFAKHEAMVAQEKKDHEAALAKATADLEATKARADEADEKAKKLDAEVKALPAKVTADLRARMALESKARGVLGAKAKLDGLDGRAVKVAMLKKLRPEVSVTDKADAYVDARLDAAMEEEGEEGDEEVEDGKGKKDAADRSVNTDDDDTRSLNSDTGGDEMSLEEARKDHHDSADEARVAMNVRLRNEWRQPVAPSAADLKR